MILFSESKNWRTYSVNNVDFFHNKLSSFKERVANVIISLQYCE